MFLKFLKFAKKLKSCVLSFCSLLNMKGMFSEVLSSKTKLNACFSRFFTFKQNRSRLQQVKSCFYSFLKFEACKKWNPYMFLEIFELAKNKTKKNEIIYFLSFLRLQKKWNPCFWSFLKLTKKLIRDLEDFQAYKNMFFELSKNPCFLSFLKLGKIDFMFFGSFSVAKSWIHVFTGF